MSETELPYELESCPSNHLLGESLQRVLGGASVVAFHAEKGLIATWSGGTGCNVYNPMEWTESATRDRFGQTQRAGASSGDTGEVYHFNNPDPVELEDAEAYAKEKFEEYGFTVVE